MIIYESISTSEYHSKFNLNNIVDSLNQSTAHGLAAGPIATMSTVEHSIR